MRFADILGGDDARAVLAARILGVIPGIVTNNQDPDGLGRVKVRCPCFGDEDETQWARIVAPMAGKERGIYFLPEVDDEVLVAFEQGDINYPIVLGALWNGKDAPPATNDDGKNNIRVIKSRSGHVIRLNDEDGKEKIEIIDKSEKNSIVIDTKENTITITSEKDIVLKAKGTITLDAEAVDVKSSQASTIKAGAGMKVEASGELTLKGATVNIN